jgi:hypothetical protein
LDSLVTACWGGSALVMAGRVTGLPVRSEARPDTFARAWLSEMAQADPGLRGRQPWKAAYERDYGWLGTVLAEHYAGNDTNVRTLLAGVLAAYEGISV